MNQSEKERALIDLGSQLVERARHRGVDAAEASLGQGYELSVRVRQGAVELMEEAGTSGLSLRVLRDARSAGVTTSDFTEAGLSRCLDKALELLEVTEPDPDALPAAPELLAQPPFPDLELFDPALAELDVGELTDWCERGERLALAVDPRLSHSEGASMTRLSGTSVLVLSSGFVGHKSGTTGSFSVVPVALDTDSKRRRGYYATVARFLEDLEPVELVATRAAERTLRQLGGRSLSTAHLPVVFSEETAASLIGALLSCLLGPSLYRKSSYLVDRLGTMVAHPSLTLIDEPSLPRGLGSRSYDGEGLPCSRRLLVDQGRYVSALLDCTSARKLGLAPTGSASRSGTVLSASVSNLIVSPGTETEASLIESTPRGLYVTEMLGFGFNAVTGDFSRGASGFLIEDGKLTQPVSEVTISSNLDTMLKSLDGLGQLPRQRGSIISPALRIAEMTVAGNG